jgi:Family of unknown function (DUF6529)
MAAVVEAPNGRVALAAALFAGCVVAVGLGVYAHEHTPKPKPLFLAGFSGALQFKTWFATTALLFVVLQVLTALWMWGRLPGTGQAPGWIAPIHRWSGAIAFVLLIPVALNCLYSLGWSDYSTRTVVHSVAGCAFYGAYTSKMLSLRMRNLPGWTLPVLGGLVLSAVVVLWLTSALWFFTSSGRPLT